MGGGILARSVRSNLLPTPAFTRSFTTTRVTSSLPPPLFHSYRPHSALNLRSSTQFHQKWSRGKWSYAKHGLLAPSFSAKHPWVAGFLRISISAAVGISLLIGIVLLHDMSTYTPHRDGHIECSPLSLHPRRGGPKNLPIIESNLDDNEEKGGMKNKPRLVIIGGGWGVSDSLFFADNRPWQCSSRCLPTFTMSPLSLPKTTFASLRSFPPRAWVL